MFNGDYLQVPVCFIRICFGPTVMRERGNNDKEIDRCPGFGWDKINYFSS